jgi:hypothetical protein
MSKLGEGIDAGPLIDAKGLAILGIPLSVFLAPSLI